MISLAEEITRYLNDAKMRALDPLPSVEKGQIDGVIRSLTQVLDMIDRHKGETL